MIDSPLNEIFDTADIAHYAPNEIIARAEDEPAFIYRIQSGYVRVYSTNSRGEEYLHIVYKTGELFPLVALTPKVQHNVIYEALDRVTVSRIRREELLVRTAERPDLSLALTMQIMEQFNVYIDRVDNLQYKFGRERLVYRILVLASRFGRQTERGLLVDLPLTQKVLGSSINLSRETVARELKRLEDRGLVAYDDRKIVILDLKQLTLELKDPINADYWGLLQSTSGPLA
jgi:CRP/FNR family transcriptional regulator